MRWSELRRCGLPAILGVLVLLGGLLLWRHVNTATDAAAAVPGGTPVSAADVSPAAPQRFSVLFAGDDFTKGVMGSTWASYPCILARTEGWNCDVDAEAGTGFVNDGRSYGDHDTARLIDRLDRDRQLYPADLVFVDAGRNDLAVLPDTVLTAVTEYLNRVAALWPRARIVVVMPYWLGTDTYGNYDQLRSGFAGAVAAAHGALLDPLAEHWFDDEPLSSMVIADHVHANALGNQTIARKIADSLTRHGLAVQEGTA